MALYLYSIDEAEDRKFIVTKAMSGQAKMGTLVHIMKCSENSSGISVSYRVTETGQDFNIKFENLKQFCKWARPDNFIARHYEHLSNKDVLHYLKISSRSFVSFCLPLILAALVIIWAVSMICLKNTAGIILGCVLSVIAVAVILGIYRYQKKHIMVSLYNKISTNWGIVVK